MHGSERAFWGQSGIRDDSRENREAPEEEEAVVVFGRKCGGLDQGSAQAMEREAQFRRYWYLGSRSNQYSRSNYNSEHRTPSTCQEPV